VRLKSRAAQPGKPQARARRRSKIHKEAPVRVIASSVRKGNVLEIDGNLYSVISAESFFPGKGTPTTQIDMRRISDGVKTTQRYKTTEQVERAFVEDREHSYLYQDGDNYIFMNPDSYEQITVPVYLQEGMHCMLSVFEGNAVAIELPQRVTLEVADTEPVTKGQTASSSYKPAKMSNGVRVMVPPHIGPGTRIVVMTADGSYVERAKD
jgi:elongation factor P